MALKKKTSRRTKRIVRKTIAGLCMASAIIVACIPAPKTAAYVTPTGYDYKYAVEATDSTPKASMGDPLYSNGVELDKLYFDTFNPGGTLQEDDPSVFKIMNVLPLTNGTYTLNWQFKIYLQTVGSIPMGVICKYNSTYAADDISIQPTMPLEYMIISADEYNKFYKVFETADTADTAEFTLKDNTTKKTLQNKYYSKYSDFPASIITENDDEWWLDKYFHDLYTQYLSLFPKYEQYLVDLELYNQYQSDLAHYNAYLQSYNEWKAAGEDPNTKPAVVEEPEYVKNPTVVNEPTLVCYVKDMKIDAKKSFFCDVNPDYNNNLISLKDYKLAEVLDYSQAAAGSPSVKTVYMPKGEPNANFNDPGSISDDNPNDGNGFRIIDKCLVIAIGDNAFRKTTNVNSLTICPEIKYIGDNAFRDSFVSNVTFSNVENIGNRAFYGCSKLDSIKFPSGATNIGTEAFYGTALTQVVFPVSVEYIGPGAFANCNRLTSLDFSTMNKTSATIDNFAFYDDIKLTDIKFSNSIKFIGDAAFACSTSVSGALTTFTFPENISSDPNGLGNFVLAGRTNLKHVIMPPDYGKFTTVELPYGTFANCLNLECVEFPTDSDNANSCGLVTFGVYNDGSNTRTIFDSIRNKDFYVRGPELDYTNAVASPRKSTWGLKTNLGNDVPYVYTDANGEEHFEISNGDYILIIDDNGILQSCKLLDNSPATLAEGIDMIIPEKVGDTEVVGIASTCFNDKDIHDNMTSLTINDNSISEIAPEAFKNCKRLEKVSIGNTVTKIGDSAFEGCNKLTYVNFEAPVNGYSSFPISNIGNNAFSTGAPTLTFEGDIEEGYGPFDWAMQYDNYVDPNNGVRVCYTSGYPTYLTVIVDNRNKMPTLVSYPHYEMIDELSGTKDDEHPLSERYIHLGETYDDNGTTEIYSMTLNEEKLVNSTLNLVVPKAIKSVDVMGYMNNSSKEDPNLTGVHTNTNNVSKYLFKDSYFDQYKKNGLFSGYYGNETDADGKKRENPAGSSLEKESKGNDILTSIRLEGVEYLPDYCFDSCEQLKSVYIGDQCESVGAAPFIGCYNLTSLAIDNPSYKCENGILYKDKGDGSYSLVEVLGSRGTLVGDSKLKVCEKDPLLSSVSEIEDSAIMDCGGVYGVDLRGMDLMKVLPDNCFKNDHKLSQIIVPDNITSVGHECFANTMEGIQVVFYGEEVFLPPDTFKDLENFAVVSYERSAVRKAARDLGADVSQTLDYTYKCQFFDWDGKELSDIIFIVEGENVSLDYVPEDPKRVGYKFTGWDKSLQNICEDTLFFATYEVDPDYEYEPGDEDSSGSKGGSGSKKKTSESVSEGGGGSGSGSSDDDSASSTSKKKKTSGSKSSGSGSGSGSGSSSGSGGGEDPVTPEDKKFYTLTVNGGNGSGSYVEGSTVVISCTNVPAGKQFDKWIPETADLGIASVSISATTLVMPGHNAVVNASFVDKGTATTTPASTTTSTSASTSKKDDGGTKVVVSKNGISNTGLASAKVTGSPDDFVIRINETQAATEAVEAALINEYGSLDNIRYSAMDITLYDATGSNLITDYSGLSISITIPIPDTLTQYAGNNKVAGVVNDRLDKLNPKYTSIDGVPCMTFTATHFSPYTIYADVTNISTGKIDATPKTGDHIEPKWFLSFGLAAISIALFFMKDRKKKSYITVA